jgi:hypothetical protein
VRKKEQYGLISGHKHGTGEEELRVGGAGRFSWGAVWGWTPLERRMVEVVSEVVR